MKKNLNSVEPSDLARALSAGSDRAIADDELTALQRKLEEMLKACHQAWPSAKLADFDFVRALGAGSAARVRSSTPSMPFTLPT